jgi:hypothetical protein
VKTAHLSFLTPGYYQRLFQRQPASLVPANGNQTIGKQTVIPTNRSTFTAPLTWRWARLKFIGHNGTRHLRAQAGNPVQWLWTEPGGQIGSSLTRLDLPSQFLLQFSAMLRNP